jgi:hypothetical protein
MRAAIVAAALLALAGCASRAPAPPCEQVSYNRREIPPGPGMLTGPRGTWTVTRHGSEDESAGVQSTAGDRPGTCHPSAYGRASDREAEGPAPPPPPRERTVLLGEGAEGAE